MTLLEYIDLIKKFAAADPDLLHVDGENEAVFSVGYDDAVGILQDIPDRMILLIPPYEKHVRHNNAMGNVWMKGGLAMALEYVEPGDRERESIVIDKAEQVLDRLYQYLFNKRNTGELYGFDPTTWEAESIGPVGANHYGYMAEFTIKDGVML